MLFVDAFGGVHESQEEAVLASLALAEEAGIRLSVAREDWEMVSSWEGSFQDSENKKES